MSDKVVEWLKIRGISCQQQPAITNYVLYEAPLLIFGYVTIHVSTIGAFTSLSPKATLLMARIGRYCSIGDNVRVGLTEHPMDRLTTSAITYSPLLRGETVLPHETFLDAKPISLGHDVWIGSGSKLRGGISVGTGAVIGSDAVVTKSVPPFAVVVGNPATIKKFRFNDKIQKLILESKWWEFDLGYVGKNQIFVDWADPERAIGNLLEAHAKGKLERLTGQLRRIRNIGHDLHYDGIVGLSED